MQGHGSPAARLVDHPLLDTLRCNDTLGVTDLTELLGITATAVRQRLKRAINAGLVEEVSDPHRPARRGRPRLGYRLTATGQQTAGDNFHDLATVLWQELRGVRVPEVRRGLLGRIGKALAATYSEQVSGSTPLQRIDSVAGLLRDRGVVCSVAEEAAANGSILPVLTTHSCPYPDLAEHDRGICAAEQTMLEDLVGEPVRLTDCRLDGGDCCRFEVSSGASLPENPAASMVQQSQRRSAVDGRQPS